MRKKPMTQGAIAGTLARAIGTFLQHGDATQLGETVTDLVLLAEAMQAMGYTNCYDKIRAVINRKIEL